MKFLYWFVGVMQILTGCQLAWSVAPGWRWVWLSLAVFWFFAGASLGVLGLARLAAGKAGSGVFGRATRGPASTPGQNKEG